MKKGSTLSERSIDGINVLIVANTYPRPTPRLYHFTSLKKLLDQAQNLLSLPSFAKAVYTTDGKVIKEDSEVQQRQTLIISCGEPFKTSPQKKLKVKQLTPSVSDKSSKQQTRSEEEEEEEEAKEERPKSRARSIYDSVSFLFNKEEKKEEEVKEEVKEEKKPNVKLPRSTKTVEEQVKDENFARFCQLSHEEQSKIPNKLSIRAMIRNAQREKFIQNYVDQNIKSDLSIDQEVSDILYDRKPLDIHFAIIGPHKSGKTSLLYEVGKSLYVKLQPSRVLVLMMNFEMCKDLYPFLIDSIVYSLSYSAYQINPISDLLKSWLLSIPKTESLQIIPKPLLTTGHVNGEELQKIGRELHAACHKGIPDPFSFGDNQYDQTHFYQVLANLPIKIAKAVGLSRVYSIIDHFDLCQRDFAQILAVELLKHPFIASAKDESVLTELIPEAVFIDTEHLVTEPRENRIIKCPKLKLTIEASDCLGCPSFLKTFTDLCDLIEEMHNNVTVKRKYTPMKSSIDKSRQQVADEKLKSLCEVLFNAKSPAVNQEILHSIDALIGNATSNLNNRKRRSISKTDSNIDKEKSTDALGESTNANSNNDKDKSPSKTGSIGGKDKSPSKTGSISGKDKSTYKTGSISGKDKSTYKSKIEYIIEVKENEQNEQNEPIIDEEVASVDDQI